MYVYIFSANSIGIIYKINHNNKEEERRSGTTTTGVSQKDLQINGKKRKRKKAEKLVEYRTCALQACSGDSDKLDKTTLTD